mgnify:CR=1 FL=1
MQDIRFVFIFDLTQEAWVKAFKQILDTEAKILDILDHTTYPENEDFVLSQDIIWIPDNNLPIESQEYINYKLNLIKETIYYPLILYYQSLAPITFRISGQLANDYGDVIQINQSFVDDRYQSLAAFYNQLKATNFDLEKTLGINKNIEPIKYDIVSRCFIVTDEQQLYYGNVWTFTRPEYSFIGMYGIKRSILDVITNNKLFKGITKLLINKIIEFAKENNLTKIIVIEPLPAMRPILIHYQFTQHETNEETSERQFFEPVSSAYLYFTYDI